MMCNVRVKRVLALLLCFAMMVSGVNVARAEGDDVSGGNESSTLTIVVQKKDNADKKISGAKITISLINDTDGTMKSVMNETTNASGECKCDVSQWDNGTYDVKVEDMDEYQSCESQSVTVTSGKLGNNENLTFKLVPKANVQINASINGQTQVTGAKAMITNTENTTTYFEIELTDGKCNAKLTDGTYKITIKQTGFETEPQTVYVNDGKVYKYDNGSTGDEITSLTFELIEDTPPVSTKDVVIKVYKGENKAENIVENAKVEYKKETENDYKQGSYSSGKGYTCVMDVDTNYSVKVSGVPGWNYQEDNFSVSNIDNYTEDSPYEIVLKKNTYTAEITLKNGEEKINNTNQAIDDITLQNKGGNGGSINAKKIEGGIYIFSDLVYGEYDILVNKDKYTVTSSEGMVLNADGDLNSTVSKTILVERVVTVSFCLQGQNDTIDTDKIKVYKETDGKFTLLSPTLSSSSNGVFDVVKLGSGVYKVEIGLDGFQQKDIFFTINKQGGVEINKDSGTLSDNTITVTLDPTPTPTPIPPLATVPITVKAGGQEAADATVTIKKEEAEEGTEIPYADGKYEAKDLENGTYEIKVEKPGYVTQTEKVTVTDGNAYSTGELDKQEITSEKPLTFNLEREKPTVSITVKVGDDKVTDATVKIKPTSGIGEEVGLLGEKYVTKKLADGMYEITVEKTGYEIGKQTVEVKDGVANPETVTISLTLTPTPTPKAATVGIKVKVGDEEITDATVKIKKEGGTEEEVTPVDGKYEVSGLADGKYEITAEKDGYEIGSGMVTVINGVAEPTSVVIFLDSISTPAPSPTPSVTPKPGTPTPVPPTSTPTPTPGMVTPTPTPTPSATPTVTPAPSEKPSVKILVTERGGSLNPISGATVLVIKEDGTKIFAKEENGIYEVKDLEDGKYTISVTKDGYEGAGTGSFEVNMGKIENPPEAIVMSPSQTTPTPGPTVSPTPSPILEVSVPAPQLQKKGAKVSIKVTASISNALKENYTFQYAWTWNGTRDNSSKDSLSKAVTKVGENTWTCDVTAVNNDGKKLTKKVEGVVIGYMPSGVKLTLLKKYSNKEIVNDVFGKSSGVSVKKIKKSGSYLDVKKNSIRAKKFKKSLSVSLEGIKYGNTAFGNISVKMEMHLPLDVKFTKKNGGKKIVCSFSKDLRKIAKNKNKKKYGIKQITVKLWYSKNGNKFKAIKKEAERYIQPTVAKSECYLSDPKKIMKKLKVRITCKASGGTVKENIKVTPK